MNSSVEKMTNLTDKEVEQLAKTWKGEKCVICQFEIDQIELKDVVESPEGLVHRHCLDEQGADFAAEEKQNELQI